MGGTAKRKEKLNNGTAGRNGCVKICESREEVHFFQKGKGDRGNMWPAKDPKATTTRSNERAGQNGWADGAPLLAVAALVVVVVAAILVDNGWWRRWCWHLQKMAEALVAQWRRSRATLGCGGDWWWHMPGEI